MKKDNFIVFLFICLFPICNSATAQMQKSCDIGIKIETPANGAQFGQNDTASVNFKIINYGPDDISTNDTIHFAFQFLQAWMPTYCLPVNILAGDSVIVGPYASLYANTHQQNNDTETICAHLLNSSATYNDPIGANDTANCTTFILKGEYPSGISNENGPKLMDLQLYPNPAFDELNIQINSDSIKNIFINIKDMAGRVLLRRSLSYPPFDHNVFKLNVSMLRTGMYLIELNQDGTRIVKKFVIQ
ncbi:MAG TPA: T9SS type A sorting domain-containing protein [Edaphocola sp.]|nr:T9SS type A sorting domain-containing protein [Edaphocola sp.]